MKHIAMVLNNIVDNIALWDGESKWEPDEGHELIDVTNHEPAVALGDIYDPVAKTFSRPVVVEVVPLKNQLLAVFQSLDPAVRAQFYPVKTTVNDALLDGDIEVARAIIAGLTVPSELQPIKDELLAKIDAEVQA